MDSKISNFYYIARGAKSLLCISTLCFPLIPTILNDEGSKNIIVLTPRAVDICRGSVSPAINM